MDFALTEKIPYGFLVLVIVQFLKKVIPFSNKLNNLVTLLVVLIVSIVVNLEYINEGTVSYLGHVTSTMVIATTSYEIAVKNKKSGEI